MHIKALRNLTIVVKIDSMVMDTLYQMINWLEYQLLEKQGIA